MSEDEKDTLEIGHVVYIDAVYEAALRKEKYAGRDSMQTWETLFAEAKGESSMHIKTIAVFKTINRCFVTSTPIPDWAARHFRTATNSWLGLRSGSLDEAFGVPTQSKTQLAKVRMRTSARWQLFDEVRGLQANGKTVDWNTLAEKYGYSSGTLKTWYYGDAKRGIPGMNEQYPLRE